MQPKGRGPPDDRPDRPVLATLVDPADIAFRARAEPGVLILHRNRSIGTLTGRHDPARPPRWRVTIKLDLDPRRRPGLGQLENPAATVARLFSAAPESFKCAHDWADDGAQTSSRRSRTCARCGTQQFTSGNLHGCITRHSEAWTLKSG